MTMTGSLEASDAAAQNVQQTPNRVTLQSLYDRINATEYIHPESLPTMTIAVLTLDNGFVVVGKSAPADPENYNEALGQQFARDDAIRQMWQLEGYLLRERLWQAEGEDESKVP
jgi:predicted P-loop ATPase/GTPase